MFDLVSSLVKKSHKYRIIKVNIIIVDDGSTTPEAIKTFTQISTSFSDIVILQHKINVGKGDALKTAFTYIKEHYDDVWIVTADADGQHLPSDIWNLVEAGLTTTRPIIGVRKFDTNVPLRSKLGNTVTHYLFKLIYGNQISDTQSGLRGFHYNEIPSLLALNSKRYAFELDALIHFTKNSKIREIPITTIYEPRNPTSHFHPLLDSATIYAVLFRQIFASGVAMILEVLLFLLLAFIGIATFVALPVARLVAGIALFSLARNFVYNSNRPLVFQVFKFILLVVLNLAISVVIINFFEINLGKSKLFGLLISYIFMFMVNFLIQKYLIFNRL